MSEPTVPPVPPTGGAPPPPPAEGGGSGGSGAAGGANAGLMIVLSYLGPLAVIPLVLAEDDDLRWHARHGLVLLGAEIVALLAMQLVFGVVAWLDFGCSGCIAHVLFTIFVLVLHIACIVRGLNGGRLSIPGVTALADRF